MNYIPTVLETLTFWEGIIHENERVFMDVFCKDAWILTSVSWDSENMRYVYILENGLHVSDSVKMDKWMEFLMNSYNSGLI